MLKNVMVSITLATLTAVFFTALQGFQQSTMPEPYKSLVVLPFDGHGWFGGANQQGLKEIITTRQVKTVIEVGTWLGKSTRFMASLLPSDGVLYAIDSFLGSPEINADPKFQSRVPIMYQQFLSNVIYAELTNKIIPVRMSSLEAVKALNITADLIYIDAAHDAESVSADIFAWVSKLNPQGVLCGDDYGNGQDNGGVRQGCYIKKSLT